MFYPLWYISVLIFAGVFNLSFTMMVLYLRLRGGTERYTKSQLWALTLLAGLFFLNSFFTIAEIGAFNYINQGQAVHSWPFFALWSNLGIYTAFILLCLGLVYPRPITKWSRLRWLVIGVLSLGMIYVIIEIMNDHLYWDFFLYLDRIEFAYYFGIFIPVFIWLEEYSRQPNKEARIIYTILIWGFLFVYVSGQLLVLMNTQWINLTWSPVLVVMVTLVVLALIRLGVAMFHHRKNWSYPEFTHIGMLLLALGIGFSMGLLNPGAPEYIQGTPHLYHFTIFMAMTFGWIIIRPILFSYGLLRYRIMGTQVKAERALAVVVTVLTSTLVSLVVFNIITNRPETWAVMVAVVVGLVILFPCWKVSNRLLARLMAGNIEPSDMSTRERRNIYLMGLQTAVVNGEIEDDEDKKAIKNLKEELGITDREHELLMDGITQHDTSLVTEKKVEGAYLIHTHGLLISSLVETEDEGTDSDIFAGMLTAVTEFVDETMKKSGEGKKRTTGSISYGPTTLVVERDGYIVLAVLINGPDDIELRQLMRDTLSDINDKHGRKLTKDWNGDLRGLGGIKDILAGFASRVKRRAA